MEHYFNTYLDKLEAAKKQKNPSLCKKATTEATKLVMSDAKKGIKEAIIAYCYMQIIGQNIEKNAIAGRERLLKMANQGVHEAIYFVALSFYSGDLGFIQDMTKSEQWCRQIALLDEKDFCINKKAHAARIVAEIYEKGEFVTKDLAEAARFLELACQFGCKDSQLILGRIFVDGAEDAFGNILEKDEQKGLVLLNQAAKKGNHEAIEAIVRYHTLKALDYARDSKIDTGKIGNIRKAIEKIEWFIR